MVWQLEQEPDPDPELGTTVLMDVIVTMTVTESLTVTVTCAPQVDSVSSDEVMERPEVTGVANAVTSLVKVEVVVSVIMSVLMVKTLVDTANVLWTVESHEFSAQEVGRLGVEEGTSKLMVEAPVIVAVDRVVKEMTEMPSSELLLLV
jgi:hypothetical protein